MKIERLESIGFYLEIKKIQPRICIGKRRWKKLEEQFNTMVARVSDYVKEHGYGWIPTGYKEDEPLAGWVLRVRSHKNTGKLRQDRMMALETAGFQWDYKYDYSNTNRVVLL